jgi:hypothetical protein
LRGFTVEKSLFLEGTAKTSPSQFVRALEQILPLFLSFFVFLFYAFGMFFSSQFLVCGKARALSEIWTASSERLI